MLVAADHFGPMLSFLFAWGICGVVPVALVGLVIGRAWAQSQAARRAAASFVPNAPLRRGKAVLDGKVVFEDDANLALRVELEQTGTEVHGKHGWFHTWKESARHLEARRFYLKLADGRLVPVLPDKNTLLVDRIDHTEGRGSAKRAHIAALQPGEHIFAAGELVEEADMGGDFLGYRDAPATRLVLRGRRRLVLSAEPLEKRHWARVRFHVGWVARWMLALVVIHGCLLLPYHLRAWSAPLREGVVERAYTTVVRHSRGSNTNYILSVRDGNNALRRLEVSRSTYRDVQAGMSVVFRDLGTLSAIGARPTANWMSDLTAAGIVLFCGFAYASRRKLSRPWYEGPLVQSGSGRLVHLLVLLTLGLGAAACGPAARKGDGRVPIGLESNEESPGDAVTSPNTPPQSPGVEPKRFGPR